MQVCITTDLLAEATCKHSALQCTGHACTYMCCTYLCTYIHTYIHTCICHTPTQTLLYIHACRPGCGCIHVHACHMYIHVSMLVCMHVCMSVYIYIHTHTHVRHMYMQIYIHTCVCMFLCNVCKCTYTYTYDQHMAMPERNVISMLVAISCFKSTDRSAKGWMRTDISPKSVISHRD